MKTQTTKPTQEENNRLIAEFMGGKFYHRKEIENCALWHFKYWQGENSSSHGYSFNDSSLYYDKCWNWLMPVVEKLKQSYKDLKGDTDGLGQVYKGLFNCDLQHTYKYTVQAIGWLKLRQKGGEGNG